MKKRLLLVLGSAAIITVGAFLLGKHVGSSPSVSTSNNHSKDFPLLARRIFAENPSEPIVNFTGLRASLRDYYQKNNLTGNLYFEYLPTGTSVRVNGDSKEVAASLMKLPVAMLLYRSAESGKIDLDKEITLKQEWLDNNFGTLYQKGAGYKLTLREAAKIMLSESDNTALTAITMSIEGLVSENENPLSFMDVDYYQNKDQTVSISARSYSSFLKCLYFSCYLGKENSQEILGYLAQSKFDTRLVSGIDKDVTVAHKIGTFNDTTQSDCGIVYLEKKNYVLCIMVDGPDNTATETHIANLSRLTFDFVKQSGGSR